MSVQYKYTGWGCINGLQATLTHYLLWLFIFVCKILQKWIRLHEEHLAELREALNKLLLDMFPPASCD